MVEQVQPNTPPAPEGDDLAERTAAAMDKPKSRRTREGALGMGKILFAAAVLLAITGVAGWRAVVEDENNNKHRLALEIAKLSTQALLVGLAAGVLVQEYQRKREQKAGRNAFRKSIYTNLVRVYSNSKKSRRILRARCRSISATPSRTDKPEIVERGVPRDVYEAQLLSINDTQLELEIMQYEIKGINEVFSDHEALADHLKKMDKYLNEVVDEFKDVYPQIGTNIECIPLSQLPMLSDFLLSGKTEEGSQSRFRTQFGQHFRDALTLIQRERLKV